VAEAGDRVEAQRHRGEQPGALSVGRAGVGSHDPAGGRWLRHRAAQGEPGGFGGIRYYLICPGCTHGREKLYTMECERPRLWRCRKCRGLAYASQRLQPSFRLQNRARMIEIRLGGLWPWGDQGKPWQGIPTRRRGMHRSDLQSSR